MITAVSPVIAGGTSNAFDLVFADQLEQSGPYSLVLEPTVSDPAGNFVDQTGDGVSNSADRFTINFNLVPEGSVGPDTFGYDALIATPQNFELTGQTGVTNIAFSDDDDAATAINLGTNSFNFYGTTYSGSRLRFDERADHIRRG